MARTPATEKPAASTGIGWAGALLPAVPQRPYTDYVDRLWYLVEWADVTARFDAARAATLKL
ncbi:hypothetical protein [Micromonospora sp. SL4-19]|uniref:hypothetical protein n=1 Tax=Micromonospora sp. SL4-19 TaxID=3399129 RepID=UPI003A4D9A2E